MRGESQRSSHRVWLGLAILAAAGIGGLTAGLSARAAFGPGASSTALADMPPADVVALRFPADWAEAPAAEPAPRMVAYASADNSVLFNPKPTFARGDARSVASDFAPASATAAPAAEPRLKPAVQAAAP